MERIDEEERKKSVSSLSPEEPTTTEDVLPGKEDNASGKMEDSSSDATFKMEDAVSDATICNDERMEIREESMVKDELQNTDNSVIQIIDPQISDDTKKENIPDSNVESYESVAESQSDRLKCEVNVPVNVNTVDKSDEHIKDNTLEAMETVAEQQTNVASEQKGREDSTVVDSMETESGGAEKTESAGAEKT